MSQYECDLKTLSTSDKIPHADLASLSREFNDFKCLSWQTLKILKTQTELLLQGLDRHETASRRKVLLFHGLAESKEVDIEDKILHILTDQLKLSDITSEHISACHRLGSNSNKPRPVLVRFQNYKHRSMVWSSKASLKSTGVTVSEFLTKTRHEVFVGARKHFGVKQSWTSEGKIVILLPDKSRRKIELMSELRPLLSQYSSAVTDAQQQATGNIAASSTPQLQPQATQAADKVATAPAASQVKSAALGVRPRRGPK